MKYGTYRFKAILEIIGINPFVFVPAEILEAVFRDAGADKGPIPIYGKVNDKEYTQTLVRYQGEWRMYINTTMLKNSPKRIGEELEISITYDPADRSIKPHPKLLEALKNDKEANTAFEKASASLRNEIIRYISQLKSEESIDRNVHRAIGFLKGENSFVGRKNP